jgi:hypothetical protein
VTVPDVWARPERLRQFRRTAQAMADGLAWRRGELADAVGEYRSRTEPAYEADCDGLLAALEAIAGAVRALGEWVGRVGDAFELGIPFGGVRLMTAGELAAALPPELRLPRTEGAGGGHEGRGDPAVAVAGATGMGLTVASAAAAAIRPADLEAVAAVVGRESAADRRVGAAGDAPRPARVTRLLEVLGLLQVGLGEAGHRWEREPDRPTGERVARAGVDGALAAAGTLAGGRAGGMAAAAACAPALGAAALACAPVGAGPGAGLGRRGAEWLSDQLLGPEPESWEREPERLAAEIGDVDEEVLDEVAPAIEEARAGARERARAHADFVLDHPWLWDDDHAGAPHHEPPPPAPDQSARGPA